MGPRGGDPGARRPLLARRSSLGSTPTSCPVRVAVVRPTPASGLGAHAAAVHALEWPASRTPSDRWAGYARDVTSMPDEEVLDPEPTLRRPRARFSSVLGVLWLVVPLVLFLLDRSVLLAGNPAHVIALAACGLIGVVLLARDHPAEEVHGRGPWTGWRLVGRTLGVVVTVLVLGALVWLRPFGATPEAVAAMSGSAGVRITDAPDHIVIRPASGTPTRGLVFQPGARVDSRAYV